MTTSYTTFLGIDLGGARGKTTAVARLRTEDRLCVVEEVNTRHRSDSGCEESWTDEVIAAYIDEHGSQTTMIAINAALTVPACVRCQLEVCPGEMACVDPAVMWLRDQGTAMLEAAVACDLDRIAAVPAGGRSPDTAAARPSSRARVAPYVHRCTEVALHFDRDLIPRGFVGRATGPVTARACQIRKRLRGLGFELNRNLLEVSPRATVQALYGRDMARGYKRDADPWETRAAIVEGIEELRFGPRSRLSREEVLRNDHCFEALLSAYTAWLANRDGWTVPEGPFGDDGWIWAPPG